MPLSPYVERIGVGLGKIGDILSSFELDLGIRVFFRPLKDGSISGLYAFDPAVGACVLVNSNHPRRRRAQTLAHEVGHFISDRSHADVLDEAPVSLSIEEILRAGLDRHSSCQHRLSGSGSTRWLMNRAASTFEA